MEDCPTGLLVDLSEPPTGPSQLFSCSSQEDKENVHPLTDSIEIERSGDTERRLSLTLKCSDEIQNRILRDVTEQALPNSAKKCLSPALRLIDDETFDFDLAVSPSIRSEDVPKEDDDEVFFGPVGFSERLKQSVVEQEVAAPLSPLNAEQFALMVKEANYVAYRIKNSKTSSGSESSPSVGSKPSCSSVDGEVSPSMGKHSRSGTFTKCQSPLELLPEELRKVLPVIDDSKKTIRVNNDGHKILLMTDSENSNSEKVDMKITNNQNNASIVKSNLKKPSSSRLQPPSKYQGSRLAKPSGIKYASSCESIDSRTSGHESDSNCSIASDNSDRPSSKSNLPKVGTIKTSGHESDRNCRIASDNSDRPSSQSYLLKSSGKTTIPKQSRLQVPGSKINRSFNSSMNHSLNVSTYESNTKGHSKISRLAVSKNGAQVGSKGVTPKSGMLSNSASLKKGNLTKSGEKKQSAEKSTRSSPRIKTRLETVKTDAVKRTGISGLKGPATKLSLIKPGEIQKRVNKTVTGTGPMKAVQSLDTINSTTNIKKDINPKPAPKVSTCVSTPVKQDKCVKPKLLANNFTSPLRTSSASSVNSTSTPVSGRRKSFLPTPHKSISSIASVAGSPLVKRLGSSTSSRRSVLSSCSSVSDSPVFNSSMTKSRIGSTKKSIGQYPDLNEVCGKSPSAMKTSKPKVVYTPQLPQKIQSKWSPIRRPKPINRDEETIQCTKRKL